MTWWQSWIKNRCLSPWVWSVECEFFFCVPFLNAEPLHVYTSQVGKMARKHGKNTPTETNLAELLAIASLLNAECGCVRVKRSFKSRHTQFHKSLWRCSLPLQALVSRVRLNAIGPLTVEEYALQTERAIARFHRELNSTVDRFYPPPKPCPKAVTDLLMSAKSARQGPDRPTFFRLRAKWWDSAESPAVVHKNTPDAGDVEPGGRIVSALLLGGEH